MTVDITPLQTPSTPVPSQKTDGVDERIMEKAREFEAVFVAQMLNYTGMGKALSKDSGFGGDAFSSMMLEQYARKIVDNGGFGLAEKIYGQLRNQQGE